MNKKITIIINPAAAGGKTAAVWAKKRKYFQAAFANSKEIYTQKPDHAVKIAKRAVELDTDYIMAVGGDGTVNEVINGMLKAETKKLTTKIIIYPQGTGSDLNRSLKLPRKTTEFIKMIKRAESKKIRVVEAKYMRQNNKKEKRYFLNAADCGMGAEVAKKLNESQKVNFGSLSYLLRIFQVLFNYKNKYCKIKADNKLIYAGKINTVIAARGNYFGGGIKIAPEADIFSDKLNLLLLKDFSKIGIILNLIKAYKGNHLSHSLVDSYLCSELKISSQEKAELELDGESVGTTDVNFKISEQEISVVL